MNDFNDILKNKFEDFREAPSQEVFNNIRSNYPKQTVFDFLSNNKYYFIAAASTILIATAIVFLSLSNKPVNDPTIITHQQNVDSSNAKSVVVADNISENPKIVVPNKISNSKPIPKNVDSNNSVEIVKINAFKSKDTLICGSVYETEINGFAKNLLLPSGLTVISANKHVKFVCSNSGTYKVFYSEAIGNKVLSDSLTLTFNSLISPEVSISKQNLCPNEDLTLVIKNCNNIPNWTNSSLNVKQLSSEKFMLKGFVAGKNAISFEMFNGNCKTIYNQEVTVAEELSYSYIATPNICSGANAILTITSDNYTPDFYLLNNEIISKNGKFDNLNSGIYCLSINYANGCQLHDTLLIRDSLAISPYFRSERDLINKNKYSFINLTNVDDAGYERNSNIEFVWKVNGELLSSGDNPTCEFTKKGDNIVELVATINASCKSVYSETIFISGSNFRIPNIFTPNGDGIGDQFIVVYEGELVHYNISIVNKLGEIVYDGNSIVQSWDGKISGNNDACEGLYYYIIRGEDKFGVKIEQKGALQLVRH